MFRKWWQKCIEVYPTVVATWALAWCLLGDRGILGLVNAWAFWLLGTGMPLGAVRAARRRSASGPILAIAWLAAGTALLARRYRWLWPAALPRAGMPADSPDGAPAHLAHRREILDAPRLLRVMSLNILKENQCAEDVLRVIYREDPDVVLIQELESGMNRQLQSALNDYDYCHQQCHYRKGGGFGFFSRFPFEITGAWDAPATRPYAVRATLALPEGSVDLYNVHLLSVGPKALRKTGLDGNFRVREAQLDAMAGEIARRGRPALALGDYNMTEGNQVYANVDGRLQDAWLAAGRGPGWTWPRRGFPPRVPVLRLDYCFCSPDVRPLGIRVLYDWTGSDHCPILVDAAIAKPVGVERPGVSV